MAYIHPVCSLCLKLEEWSFPKPQISQCRKLAASVPLQKQSSFSQMVGQPVCYCRGLEEAGREAGREQPCPVGFYLRDPHHWHSLCQSGSSLPSPSFLISVSHAFSLYLFVCQSVCLSASCQCHLSGFSTIRTVCFLNLQLPLLGKCRRKLIRPAR